MRLARERVRRIARARGLTLTEALRRAAVSRNAFYQLARRDSVLPSTVRALGEALGVLPSELLEERPSPPDERTSVLLREARRIHAAHPRSSFDNIWHTLWLLEEPPAERLRRSLARGRARPLHG